MPVVLVDLGVDRVAAAAEVDEVEQRERVLQLLARDREPRGEIVGVEAGVAVLAAGGEDVREQRLEHAEALGRDRPDGAVAAIGRARRRGARGPATGLSPSCCSRSSASPSATASRSALGSSGIARPFWRSTQPASGSIRANGVSKTPSVERARVGERAVHPPGGVALHGDAGRADGLADLPGARDAVRLDVEVGRQPEVALAPRREADVAADAGDPERADGGAVEILADDVPDCPRRAGARTG